MNIGFIGAGQMAQALAAGIAEKSISAENSTAIEFWISDPSSEARDSFRQRVGEFAVVHVVNTNADIIPNARIVFLAVKPQFVSVALENLLATTRDLPKTILVSIVAGMTIDKLSRLSGCQRIVRVMPNTPCLIGRGTSGVVASPEVNDQERDEVLQLLKSVGTVNQVSEAQIDAVTGLSGSGPAYVFTFIEALCDGGVLNGLPRDIASALALETVLGAAELVRQTGEPTALLRDRVTSPGGTTIAGLKALEAKGFRDAVISAVTAATERSRELGS